MFKYEIRNGIAHVIFDSGGMNMPDAVGGLAKLVDELGAIHAKTPLKGVVLKGNRFGGRRQHRRADVGDAGATGWLHRSRTRRVLYTIEDGPVPWLALIDGFALGGIYELALACRGIVATEKSTLGFPEIRLNIFPGSAAPSACRAAAG